MDPLWMLKQSLNSTEEAALSNHTTNSSYSDFHDPAFSTLELLDSPTRTSLVILYSTTSVIAFVGNLIVIIVETFGRRSAANLRKFLINLAISDILFAVFSVPFTYTDFMYGRWIFFPWLCPWAQFVQILSIFVTSFTLTLISIERYYAILYPLSNQNKWLTTKSQYMLILGWFLAILWASIPNTKIITFVWNNQTYLDCRPDMELYGSRYYNIVSVMSTFGFPLLIQSYCYYSVIRCLLSKDTVTISQACRRHNREMKRVIRMLVAVVILFLISWLPIKIFITILTYSPEWLFINDTQTSDLYVSSYFVCHWLAMASSCTNPLIYSFLSRSFRFDFKDLITKICSDRRDSLACAHVPISRTSHNPYIDYESRNSSLTNAVKLSPNGQMPSVLMMLIDRPTEQSKINTNGAEHKNHCFNNSTISEHQQFIQTKKTLND